MRTKEGGKKRKKGTRGREAGKDEKAGGKGKKKERQKDEDESVGEMMGIKKRTIVDEVEFIIRDKRTLETGAHEAEPSTKKLGRIICIVAGG